MHVKINQISCIHSLHIFVQDSSSMQNFQPFLKLCLEHLTVIATFGFHSGLKFLEVVDFG